MSISENDWELVNAFHDSELTGAARTAFARRLREEAALAEALHEVTQAAQSLKALKPQRPPIPAAQVSQKQFWLGGLAAAFLALAFALWSLQDRAPGILDLHATLQEQAFEVGTEDIRNVAIADRMGVHDLSGANLVPVFEGPIESGSLAHYAGVNGCRLTYFKRNHAFELPPGPEAQAISWTTVDGAHHAIIATGMDLQKFDAIATYLQHVTHDLARAQVFASMTRATQSALPCIG